MRAVVLLLALLAANPSAAQNASGVDEIISLCHPISATGDSIRAGLRDAGWTAETRQSGAQAARDLVGSQMWSFTNDMTTDAQLAAVDELVFALNASLVDPAFGEIYTKPDEVVLLLTQGVNLSCLWVGNESDAFSARVAAIGGFPNVQEPSSVTTAGRNQTVEAGGADWIRLERYAILADNGRAGPYAAAARLDRSPAQ